MGAEGSNASDDMAFDREKGVLFQSFSPLCGPCTLPDGKTPDTSLLDGPLVTRIGAAHNKTGAQVSLKWLVQQVCARRAAAKRATAAAAAAATAARFGGWPLRMVRLSWVCVCRDTIVDARHPHPTLTLAGHSGYSEISQPGSPRAEHRSVRLGAHAVRDAGADGCDEAGRCWQSWAAADQRRLRH
jgi:hypothetical protein